jgi:hypothetical protein
MPGIIDFGIILAAFYTDIQRSTKIRPEEIHEVHDAQE